MVTPVKAIRVVGVGLYNKCLGLFGSVVHP